MCAQYKDIVSNSTPAKAEDINKTHISKHTHTLSLSHAHTRLRFNRWFG